MATTALKYLNQYITTTLSVVGGIDASQTTGIVIQSSTGLETTKAGVALFSYTDPLNTTNAEWITYTAITANELQGVTRGAEGGTGKTHSNGVVIAFPISESHINNLNAMFDTTGLDLAQIATPANPDSGRNKLYFKSDGEVYKLTSAGVESTVASSDGWTSTAVTLTYSSADAPTFVATTGSTLVALIGVGDRIKLTQTTAKYFIVTAIDATTITLYGGTDYTLANAAISSVYFSHAKTPIGFPTSHSKWTVSVVDTSDHITNTPTNSAWYNATNISLPIGAWRTYYSTLIESYKTSSTYCDARATLSTANNSESDTELTSVFYYNGASGDSNVMITLYREKNIAVAAKTAYYLNYGVVGNAHTTVKVNNTRTPSVLRAICSYL